MNEISKKKLATCHRDLQDLVNAVDLFIPVFVIEGHRGEVAQNEAVAKGFSKLAWPLGSHNSYPSRGIDFGPDPLDYTDTNKLYYFAGFVMCAAKHMQINLRWGGCWKSDLDFKHNKFFDGMHYELVGSTDINKKP